MRRVVFDPLGMSRSSFSAAPDAPNVATFYALDGTAATHYRFSALAPVSLYTNARDLARFVAAHVPGPAGEAPGRGVLAPDTLARMRTPHGVQLGIEIWGLGTMLYVPNGAGDFIFGHDGHNEPAINTAARLDPASGDGIVVLETGNRLLATELAGEWVYWKTGMVDFLAFGSATSTLVWLALGGWIAILLAAALLWRRRRAA
jgi:CubicO group peptidase (beta-lactamase class C family)